MNNKEVMVLEVKYGFIKTTISLLFVNEISKSHKIA
jgi:hypothetical protein